jgi:hypothetical protein
VKKQRNREKKERHKHRHRHTEIDTILTKRKKSIYTPQTLHLKSRKKEGEKEREERKKGVKE